MKFTFRPMLWLTVVSLPAFGVLMWLGLWQLDRLVWKQGLMEKVEVSQHAAPVSLTELLRADTPLGELEYRRVFVTGNFEHDHEVYLFTTKSGLGVGYQIFTPLRLKDGRRVFVDRGFVPADKKAQQTRAEGLLEGPVTVTGLARNAVQQGWFTPDPDLDEQIWFSRDLADMARSSNLEGFIPLSVDADLTPNSGGWPLGGQTIIKFSNNHLGYAITWFGLGITLVIIYLLMHWRAGRLTFRGKIAS